MLRRLKYFFAFFLLIIIVISLAGLIIAWQYQNEIKQLIISQVNKHINTEVRVGDVSFSVLRKFPRASLEFRDVLIKVPEGYNVSAPGGNHSDTLFTAQSLFLQFGLRNIFTKNFRINSIHALNGVLYLAVNEDEQENYRFWKKGDSHDESFDLDLQDLRLNNYRISFSNDIKDMHIESDIRRLELRGNFSRTSYRLITTASGSNRLFRHQGLTFTGNQDISARVSLNVDNGLMTIEEGTIELSGIKLTALGIYDTGDPGSVDIKLGGYNLDIATLITILPEKDRKRLEPYRFSGKFDFDSSISGELNKLISPSITASFKTQKGEILRKDSGMRLTDIALTGYFTNGISRNTLTSKVEIESFSTVFGNGSLRGRGTVTNLSQPDASFDINASFLLEELARFYKPGNIRQMAGSLSTELSVKGQLRTPFKLNIEELNKMDLNGVLEIKDGLLEISESRYIASGIDGSLNLGKTLRTPGLNFNIGSDHFLIRGEIDNGLPWLLGYEQIMRISGKLYSRQLNLDNYIFPDADGRERSETSEPLLFPSHLELNLDFMVDNLGIKKFSSTGVSGKLSYKPRMMTLNAVEFNSMSGTISGNGVIVQRINNDFMFQSQVQLQGVDMQQMFYSFNNFGQTFIHGDHLKGSLTGTLGFISEWSPYLKVIWEKLLADSKVELKNGELINFEPMLGLARFIDVSELQHIRFSTLNNEIYIRNKVVTIPQMDINSSAFNISGSGTHRFDGQFDYRMKVLLSDVLYGKARRAKPENQKYGIVEDDGLGRTSLYLLVSGTSGDYRVSYDRGAVRDMIRDNIAGERNALRQMLHEEFGWFSSDSLAVKGEKTPVAPGPVFRITWDEEDEKATPETIPDQPAGSSRQNNDKRLRIIWDEEQKPPDTPNLNNPVR